MTRITGHCLAFADNVNTGVIVSVKHLSRAASPEDLVPYLFEADRPGIAARLEGAVLVAGVNFGSGSSREHPVHALKAAGVRAVLARSFARSFFRNAINLGLPAAELDTSGFADGHRLEIDLGRGLVVNHDLGKEMAIRPLPRIMADLLAAGVLIPYIREHGRL